MLVATVAAGGRILCSTVGWVKTTSSSRAGAVVIVFAFSDASRRSIRRRLSASLGRWLRRFERRRRECFVRRNVGHGRRPFVYQREWNGIRFADTLQVVVQRPKVDDFRRSRFHHLRFLLLPTSNGSRSWRVDFGAEFAFESFFFALFACLLLT